MWNPGFHFDEWRKGTAHGYARRFCLLDTFNRRGTMEKPGLMAGLDEAGLDEAGLDEAEPATGWFAASPPIWQRWRPRCCGVAKPYPTYIPRFIKVETAQGPVEALGFVANHETSEIALLCHADQVRHVATGRGAHGTSLDYLEGIAAHFAALGIDDSEVAGLLEDVREYLAMNPEPPPPYSAAIPSVNCNRASRA